MEYENRPIHTSKNDPFVGFAQSRIGGRTENQDSYSYALTRHGLLVTVCDGMGGGPGGKTASSIAVTEIVNGINDAEDDGGDLRELVRQAVLNANAAIIKAGEDNPELKGMGSTATVLLLNEHAVIIAHVGDSRVYQLRGKKKVFRTFDHSVVFEMVKQGIIDEEQARCSAQSNVITRALGVSEDLEVEVEEERPYERGDRFMLTTDGIHGTMPERELLQLATSRNGSMGKVVDHIATTADDLGRLGGGGHDNLTLVIVETKNDSKLKETMSRKTKLIIKALGALCALSLLLNIVLFSCGSGNGGNSALEEKMGTLNDSLKSKDSIIGKKDSVIKAQEKANKVLSDSIGTLNGHLQAIREHLPQTGK